MEGRRSVESLVYMSTLNPAAMSTLYREGSGARVRLRLLAAATVALEPIRNTVTHAVAERCVRCLI